MREGGYSPAVAGGLALSLVALGFIVGYGYQVAQPVQTPSQPPAVRTPAGRPAPAPPTVKGLRVSPDGRTVAFTGVSDVPEAASRFLLDLQSRQWSATETPAGWQDYNMQWSQDGRRILFHRQRIPRKVAETEAGLYEEQVRTGGRPESVKATALAGGNALPEDERSVSGFWGPDGELVVKTRREPKALYQAGETPKLIDRASGTFLQNRAVRENGRSVYYVVRNIGDRIGTYALFRIDAGVARQISDPMEGVEWSYLSEDARWMVVCRKREDGDWSWTLYKVQPQKATAVTTRTVPGDVIAVFWSPDGKYILGASGKALWSTAIPSLETRQLGERNDWNADDAAWLSKDAAVVAANGILWKVTVPAGEATRLWKFPEKYWK